MFLRKKSSGLVVLLKPGREKTEEGVFHELIGLRRMDGNIEIGVFETRYRDYAGANHALKALIKTNLFHAGIIRTYYADGSVQLQEAYVTEKEAGKQIVGDLLGYIVGNKELGAFKTEKLFLSRQNEARSENKWIN